MRSANCLKNDNIVYIRLSSKIRARNVENTKLWKKKSNEIREVLKSMEELGMMIENWPPENIEELVKG